MDESIKEHMVAFSKEFIKKERADRWMGILSSHKPKNLKHSSKLYDHLDRDYMSRNDELLSVTSDDKIGVFYDFFDAPVKVTFGEAKEMGDGRDAIFSIAAGKHAVFFFHENENYELKKKI